MRPKFELTPIDEEESKKILVENMLKKKNRKKYRETVDVELNQNL